MKKILHIITGLGSGGAENMLYKLLKYSDKERYYHEVLSLMDEGVYGKKIEELGIRVHYLKLNKTNAIVALFKGKKISAEFDIIDTWLYHADLFGFILSKINSNKKLIWNIRQSNLDSNANKSRTMKIIKLNSKLARYVNTVTYNSNKALESHMDFGYKDKESVVIPNGFELENFKFSQEDRINIREKLGLKDNQWGIITVGRWDIQKDYYTLLKAVNHLKEHILNFKLIMVGNNLDYENKQLVKLIESYNLEDDIILLGRRNNIPALLSSADIYISSSLGESFSNSIGEAMACELTCVVTDVGDSRLIVGETGIAVNAQDYLSMSEELSNYIKKNNMVRNKSARGRIINNYDINKIVRLFEHNYNIF